MNKTELLHGKQGETNFIVNWTELPFIPNRVRLRNLNHNKYMSVYLRIKRKMQKQKMCKTSKASKVFRNKTRPTFAASHTEDDKKTNNTVRRQDKQHR